MKCIKKIEINKDQLEMVTGGLGYETGPLDEIIDYPYMSILGVRV